MSDEAERGRLVLAFERQVEASGAALARCERALAWISDEDTLRQAKLVMARYTTEIAALEREIAMLQVGIVPSDERRSFEESGWATP